MMSDPTGQPGAFAAVFAALYVAHQVADHWVQTDHQAAHKGDPGWPGRLSCAAHVTTYTLTGLFCLTWLMAATGLRVDSAHLIAGLLISGVSHYVADRRTPLRNLAALFGASRFYALGAPRPGRDDNPTLGGAYALDQSFHMFFLFAAALMIAA